MYKSKELYDFLMEQTSDLTENWYATMDHEGLHGVYATSDTQVIERLKQQNYQFHLLFCRLFLEGDQNFAELFRSWLVELSSDVEHLDTPVHEIIEQFFRVEEQYLDLIQDFCETHKGVLSYEEIKYWNRKIIKRFSDIMVWFVRENSHKAEERLHAQQETILELSCPIIPLTKEVALLPLVGDIDTARARVVLEHTIEECAKREITHLFIDLSGVMIIDTMVAQELFQLIETLRLIGVKTTLSGLRPEVAQTAIQLGIHFEDVKIEATLTAVIEHGLAKK
ncbi:anti-sigma-factor antagonist [Listeria floridensis FSL S10-1187]|uniref:Anti-sigma-factor antagonist n=1 Tax=Listeria floridensis FSL S10-1187 TaxID=1265817 RepID=A0ABN0RIG9_9LIST|nr:STAS domain-containing protein [Listeria floridensis]EUJ33685.1 anti-sigma-factor antagonist [Listeria floridensis FSL S10-1187]